MVTDVRMAAAMGITPWLGATSSARSPRRHTATWCSEEHDSPRFWTVIMLGGMPGSHRPKRAGCVRERRVRFTTGRHRRGVRGLRAEPRARPRRLAEADPKRHAPQTAQRLPRLPRPGSTGRAHPPVRRLHHRGRTGRGYRSVRPQRSELSSTPTAKPRYSKGRIRRVHKQPQADGWGQGSGSWFTDLDRHQRHVGSPVPAPAGPR